MSARSSAVSCGEFQSLESRVLLSNVAPVIRPDNVSVTPLSSQSIRLDWDDRSVNETGFMIFRSIDNVDYQKVATTPAGAESWVDTSLVENTKYFYRIKARAETANSTATLAVSATTLTSAEDTFARFDSQTGQLNVRGTVGDDIIGVSIVSGSVRTSLNGVILNFDANDVQRISVLGLTGSDRISVGLGVSNIYISGGEGDDSLFGADGNDRLDGGPGNDLIKGSDGDDSLTGGDGDDTMYGQIGNDLLEGGSGNDKMLGGDDDDTLYGNDGDDRLYGEDGIDRLLGGGGRNYIRSS